MNKYFAILLFIASILSSGCKEKSNISNAEPQDNVKFWLTDSKQKKYFTEQSAITISGPVSGIETITVNTAKLYQVMDGFGFALTGGSALHLFNMDAASRKQLLTELFAYNENNIGVSYLRISIGASDLDPKVFSYDDLPFGEIDLEMQKFSLAEDHKYLIPVLKEILSINPDIKILGSPWSAPLWMKTNNNSIGGSLKLEFYGAYSKYLVKYVQEMKKEGITIDAITVQNEPLHSGNNPSMYMTAYDQAIFIKTSLGPAFKSAELKTKIIIYDHNADRIDYPLTILDDPEAKKYVDGSAFHLYGGNINSLNQVHNSHPDKNLYFTEQWIGVNSNFDDNLNWHISYLIVGATRNWCKTVLEWNLASNENLEPHTAGGCTQCLGAITIQGNQVTRNSAYYIIAHASKFVRPGSQRIESNIPTDLSNVAFITPEGKKVLIVMNNSSTKKQFNISVDNKVINTSLSPDAAGTYIW